MVKENVRMIKAMRKVVMDNLKNGCYDTDTLEFARIILYYDSMEEEYNMESLNNKNESQLKMDISKDRYDCRRVDK